MSPPCLSLIISTYNRPDVLAKTLAGVALQTRLPDEVLIADDGSGQSTRVVVETWAKTQPFRVQHVWQEDDGFRKTVILNKSVVAAAGDYLVFTDGDCVPHARYVEDHLAVAELGFWVQARRSFVGEGFVRQFEPGRTSVFRWMLTGRITGAAKCIRLPFPIVRRDTGQRGIIGCNLAVWREDLIAINGFDEEYSGWGIGEDSDLGTRLYHLGRRRKFVHAHAIVFHLNHPIAPRDHVADSLTRLEETIRSGKVRCVRGLDQYLPRSESL
jgi:glycosyltransferase involved in cell wall biosynthesis